MKSLLFSPISVVSRKSLNHINTEKASSQFVFAFHETTHRHVTMLGMQKLIISEEVNWTWQKIPRSSASHNTDAGLRLAGEQFTPDKQHEMTTEGRVIARCRTAKSLLLYLCDITAKKNLQTTQQKASFWFRPLFPSSHFSNNGTFVILKDSSFIQLNSKLNLQDTNEKFILYNT